MRPTKDDMPTRQFLPKCTYNPRTCSVTTVKILGKSCIAVDGSMVYVAQIKTKRLFPCNLQVKVNSIIQNKSKNIGYCVVRNVIKCKE